MGSKRKRKAQEAVAATPAAKRQQKNKSNGTAQTPKPTIPLDVGPFLLEPRGTDLQKEVELYNILKSEDVSDRLAAANAIISGLLGGEGVEESTLQRHLERRLFRGLASGVKAARLGYSIVLAELLSQLFGKKNLSEEKYPGLTFDTVLEFLIAKTKPEGDLNGQEFKDHFLGLLFGLQSFVRAKILFENDARWFAILDKLFELQEKKSWIREECGWVIVEAFEQMNQDQAQRTLKKLNEIGLAASPEGVGIWLAARNRFPDMKFPSKPWGHSGNPLEHLKTLAKALKESEGKDKGDQEAKQAKQTGNWNPKLHFVWSLVLEQFAERSRSSEDSGVADFENFWKVAVDENLFSKDASRERKFWGLLLFQKMFQDPQKYEKLLPAIFSRNLVRCLINHVSEEDRFLNKSAEKSLNVLIQAVESNPTLLATVLPRLISENGTYNFDRLTKTKTIEKLLGFVDENNAKSIVKILVKPTLSVKIDGRLLSIFTHFLTDLNGGLIPCTLATSLKPDAVDMEEEVSKAKDSAISVINKLLKKSHKLSAEKAAPYKALALLYSLVIFQLYDGESDAISTLEELKLCYDKLIRHKDTEEEDVDASGVLVELLLSFISKPSALLRKVSQHVFSAFMTDMTAEGLKLITDVLESSENLRGQQEMFDQEVDGDIPEEEDSDVEMDSDVEVVDMNGEEGELHTNLDEAQDESDDEDEDDDAESENADDQDDDEAKKLDDALAKALGTHALDPAAEESDSDADMTDSEMMELDSKLVEIFSQRRKAPNKKQEQKDAKETIVNFKSRILDLLDIYVKKQAANPLAFGLLLPLLQLIRTTKTKNLADKARDIITAFSKAAKKTTPTSVDVSAQIKLLKAIHLEASKDPSHGFARAASTSSLLVASNVYKADKENFKKIGKVYLESMTSWDGAEPVLKAPKQAALRSVGGAESYPALAYQKQIPLHPFAV
ncbi:putative DNA polymerase V [Glarea lozoyensis 74030]|uniref:Putative DNA polymerase V n=1 Tax=Glarea lozoyensis (strain ATCC 74030 / MF5533) TaxID=1104152 RepID=H0EFC8_GLAL7|nr:putative DNA polymerase V [Glarea lozoyensis 74030]